MNKIALVLLSTALAAATPSTKGDLIFKAMSDELERSMTRLELKGHPKPYYISYMVSDRNTKQVSASFGAVTDQTKNHFRNLSCDVRIGDYKLDSSTGGGGHMDLGILFGGEDSHTLTVDNNYDALRRALWLETDAGYKQAIEGLKATETYLKQNTVEDRPDSFSKEKPVVHIEPLQNLDLDQDKWSQQLRKVSGVFKEYPKISNSKVDLIGACEHRWFMNNEGFKYQNSQSGYTLFLSAQTQAPDGMILADAELIPALLETDLPGEAALESTAKELAERLEKIAAAPIVSNYRGPVLFEEQAGASFFHQLLDSKLVATRSSMLGLTGDMHENLGERFLPKFISVIDDPKAKEWHGQKLYGNYEVDDEGVEGEKITLIDKGILKTLCTGRVPSRTIKQSNGHFVNGSACTSDLFIISENKLSKEALKARLIELGKEDGLKSVYIVKKLMNIPTDMGSAGMLQSLVRSLSGGSGGAMLYPPILLYKVSTEDGHEELVRGGSFASLSMRVLRDIDATGDDEKAYPAVGRASGLTSIVAPSVLVKEIEIQRPEHTTSKPPILKNPFFDK